MRRTKIVCTIGPSSSTPELLKQLIEAGMDVARINLSHANRQTHAQAIESLREAMAASGRMVAIMLDTKGPEIRVGKFAEGRVYLEAGSMFTLTTRPVTGTRERVFVPYDPLPQAVSPGMILLLDDGKVTLQVESVADAEVRCRVLNGGFLSERKKLTLPGVKIALPPMSEDDAEDLRFGVEQGVDYVAASFVRNAEDVRGVQRLITAAGGDIPVIAKIESREGVENLEEILQVADGLMVARGDMGVEYPIEEVPLIQKRIITRCNQAGKPVVTATQMLESMIQSPRPTRAEASDVANAILDGTDAVMLSAETALGEYPVEAVQMMARIAERTDSAIGGHEVAQRSGAETLHTVTDAISHATCDAATNLGAAAIITATQSGVTARMVARYRPPVPVIAATPSERVVRRLRLVWGVVPVHIKDKDSTGELINETILECIKSGLVRQGDLVVITAGVPVGALGSTNMLKVHIVAEILLRGAGIGQRIVKGQARLVRTPADARRIEEGDVAVVAAVGPELESHLRRAAAVIVEAGVTGAGAGVEVAGIPVIAGANDALSLLEDGMAVTVDTPRGLVYRGDARVL